MKLFSKISIILLALLDVWMVGFILLRGKTFQILSPMGSIAHQERTLLLTVIFLGLSIIIPTLFIAFFIVFRYSESKKKTHRPESGGNAVVLFLFWAFPSLIVAFLIGLIWSSTHALDPFRPLQNSTKPLTIQVVALQWKWLFIYPEYNIASVNYVVFPEKTPVTFELTADAPMNSFWIPRLGGQMYAMEGMVNRTHLIADQVGEFPGSTAEISGEGFAGMRFTAKATTKTDFSSWVQSVQQSGKTLDMVNYRALAKPSKDTPHLYYAPVEKDLYNQIVAQFGPPSTNEMHGMKGMRM